MKKNILSISLLCIGAMTAAADEISLGYCDGSSVTESLSSVRSVAITLPSEEFQMYRGSKIIGVRIGLDSDAAKGVDVFIHSGDNDRELAAYRSGTLYKGWNEIYFDTPVDYPEALLKVGYEVPTGVTPGLSALPGLTTSGSCLADDGLGWKDLSAQGASPLCIQLLIDGDTYTCNDAAMLQSDGLTAAAGLEFEAMGFIRNNTSRVIDTAELSYEIDGAAETAVATMEEVLPGEIGIFHVSMTAPTQPGEYDVAITVVSVGGRPDEFEANNTASLRLDVVGDLVKRKVLVEEFTGQNCQNCPTGQEILHEAMRGIGDIVMIAHHTGFYSDDMTAPGSDQLHFFYNKGGSTYAPALMIDRIQKDNNPGPVGQLNDKDAIRERLTARSQSPAEFAIELRRNYNVDTREVTVQADLRHVAGTRIGNNPVVTIALLEDGIVGFQSPNYTDYIHNDAVRQFVTAVLGDPISLDANDEATITYSVKVLDGAVTDNMRIVAFVSNHDSEDCNNCHVYNAEACTLAGHDEIFGSGVGTLSEPSSRETAGIYDCAGRRINSLQKGINIIRYTDGTSEKVIAAE